MYRLTAFRDKLLESTRHFQRRLTRGCLLPSDIIEAQKAAEDQIVCCLVKPRQLDCGSGTVIHAAMLLTYMALDRDRRVLLATSIAYGLYPLILTPVYSIFVNPEICQLSPATCVDGVKFAGGEALLLVPIGLLVFPLMIMRGGSWGIVSVFVVSLLLGIFGSFEYVAGLLLGFKSLARMQGCYLYRGNCLDHNIFHASQFPFLLILLVFSLRTSISGKQITRPR